MTHSPEWWGAFGTGWICGALGILTLQIVAKIVSLFREK
jgi:hypothetical protein